MPDVFISYAHEDEPRVRPLVKALEKQNWSVYSVKSAAVKEEAGEGARRGRLVPVRLDAVEPPLGRGFRDIQIADLTRHKLSRPSAPLRSLLKDIGKFL